LDIQRNCGGVGNDKYKKRIGAMEYYQCPISLITEDAWGVIEMILTQEETGIPIHGTDLLGQMPAMYHFRQVIMSERAECQREIAKMEKNKTPASEQDAPTKKTRPDIPKKVPKSGKDAPVRKFNVPVRPQHPNPVP